MQKAFQSAQAGSYASADSQLSKLILEWEKTGQPDDETAALYKTRGVCRQSLGQLPAAREDLSQALRLSMTPGSQPDPAEVQRTYQLRARVNQKLGNAREQADDLTAAIARLDQLDMIEATNPQLFKDRAEARMRTGEWPGAAEDAERAQLEFKQLGDRIRALLAAADGARVRVRVRVRVRARARVRVRVRVRARARARARARVRVRVRVRVS